MSNSDKVKGIAAVGISCFITFFLFGNLPPASIAYFMTEMGTTLELSTAQMTSIMSASTLGLMVTLLFAGPLMDKYSPRKIMFAFCTLCALSVIAMGLAPNYISLYLCIFARGVSGAVHIPGVNKIVSIWFEKKWLLTMNAALISGGALGYIVALNTCGFFRELLGGWQNYFITLGILMLALSFLWIIAVPERSSRDATLNKEIGVVDADNTSVIANCKYILKSPKVWCCLIGEMGFGAAITLLVSYTSTSLQMAWGMEPQAAGTLQSTVNTGSLFGYFIIPAIIVKTMKGRDTSLLAGIFIFLSTGLWIFAFLRCEHNIVLFVICFVIGGFLNGLGYTASRTFLMEQPEVAGLRSGTALGIFNFLSNVAVLLSILGLSTLFVAMPGRETTVMAIMLSIGFISAIAMFVLYGLNNRGRERSKTVQKI